MTPRNDENKHMSSKTKTQSFAKAFEDLEEITRWFESGDMDLDEGLKKFERGLELSKFCQEQLAQVENKVKEIKMKYEEKG